MARLIDVLNDEERAVTARIYVLKEKEETLKSRIMIARSTFQKLQADVRTLERKEEILRGKLKSSKLKRFNEDKVWPQAGWKWNQTY